MMQEDGVYVSRTDVMATVPMITSYAVWVRSFCGPHPKREQFLSDLDGIINKIQTISDKREQTITRPDIPFTANEVELLAGAMVYFTANVAHKIKNMKEREQVIQTCDRMRAFLRDNYPLPVSQN